MVYRRVFCTLAFVGSCALTSHAASPGRIEWVKAQVISVDAARNKVLLKHQRIASADMDAMTMPFDVQPGQLPAGLKRGDTIDFSVQVQGDDLVIARIRRTPRPH